MSELVQFLRDRLDEDAAVAQAASPGPWAWTGEGDAWGQCGPTLTSGNAEVLAGWGHDAWGLTVKDEDRAHIVRHDPARILAEVNAKRRLLDWLASRDEWALDNNLWTWDSDDALLLLALPYADHPAYKSEWRP